MKLAVGFSYYNDLESIKRSIPSFINGVDYIFAIDGKYEGNPNPNDYSIDGSTEYLKTFDKVVLDKYVGYEYEKRQRYCNLCKEYDCDYLLIIDSDEYVVKADWKEFRENILKLTKENENQSFFGVSYIVDINGYECAYPRLWYKPYCIEYYKAHCIFKDNRTGLITRSSSATAMKYLIKGIVCSMDDSLRSKGYLANTVEYQKKMIEMERPLRQSLK